MQIKEVKIYGYQSEKTKLTLTFQVCRKWERYIVRKNRKIIFQYPNTEKGELNARIQFFNTLYGEYNQLQLNI